MDASVTKKSVDMNFKNKNNIILPFQLWSTAQSGASVGGLLSNGEPTRLGFTISSVSSGVLKLNSLTITMELIN